jgi:hypothetical protein
MPANMEQKGERRKGIGKGTNMVDVQESTSRV